MELLDLCRICLRNDGNLFKILRSITPKADETSSVTLEFYEFLCEILLKNNSHCFGKICQKCQFVVHNMYSLLVQSENANKVLSQIKTSSVQLRKLSDDFLKRINVEFPDSSTQDIATNISSDIDQTFQINETPVNAKCPGDSETTENSNADAIESRNEQVVPAPSKQDHSLVESLTSVADDLAEILGEDFDVDVIEIVEEKNESSKPPDSYKSHQKCFLCHQKILRENFELHLQFHLANAYDSFTIEHSTFICSECPEVSSNMSRLKEHMSVHHGFNASSMPMLCEFCGATFDRIEELFIHRGTHDELKRHQCRVCFTNGIRRNKMLEHIQKHIDQFLDMFPDIRTIMIRKKTVHKETSFECKNCENQYSSRDHLRNHLIEKHGRVNDVVCEICKEELLYEAELTRHKDEYSETYACQICELKFICMEDMNAHQFYHSGGKFSCSSCQMSFEDETNLRDHFQLHLVSSFRCEHCGRYLRTRSYYDHHLCQHAAKKLHQQINDDVIMQDVSAVAEGVDQTRKTRRVYRAKRPVNKPVENTGNTNINFNDRTILTTNSNSHSSGEEIASISKNPIMKSLLEKEHPLPDRILMNNIYPRNTLVKRFQGSTRNSETNDTFTKMAKTNTWDQNKSSDLQGSAITFIPGNTFVSNPNTQLNALQTNHLMMSNVNLAENGLQLKNSAPAFVLSAQKNKTLNPFPNDLFLLQKVQINHNHLSEQNPLPSNDIVKPPTPEKSHAVTVSSSSVTNNLQNELRPIKPKISVRNDLMAIRPCPENNLHNNVTNPGVIVSNVHDGVVKLIQDSYPGYHKNI